MSYYGNTIPPPPTTQVEACNDPLRHRKRKGSHSTPKYGLLFAASDGCLPCVRYWHEEQGVSLLSTSDNHADWDVRSYAQYSGQAEITYHIGSRLKDALASGEQQATTNRCPGVTAHTLTAEQNQMLACAARDGCVQCCSILLPVSISDRRDLISSTSSGVWDLSPMGEAIQGAEAGSGCADVVALLKAALTDRFEQTFLVLS